MSDHGDLLKVVTSASLHLPIPRKFFFWPPGTWNHIVKRILGNTDPSLNQVYIKQSNAIYSAYFTNGERKAHAGETTGPRLLTLE